MPPWLLTCGWRFWGHELGIQDKWWLDNINKEGVALDQIHSLWVALQCTFNNEITSACCCVTGHHIPPTLETANARGRQWQRAGQIQSGVLAEQLGAYIGTVACWGPEIRMQGPGASATQAKELLRSNRFARYCLGCTTLYTIIRLPIGAAWRCATNTSMTIYSTFILTFAK